MRGTNCWEAGKWTDDTDTADSRKLKPKQCRKPRSQPFLPQTLERLGNERQQAPLKVEGQLELRVELIARMNLSS